MRIAHILVALGLFAFVLVFSSSSATSNTGWPPNLSDPAYLSPFNPYPTDPSGDLTGQCTWYVYGRAKEEAGIEIGKPLGNAQDWWYNVKPRFSGDQTPLPNSIAVWSSSDGVGHVAYVEDVVGDTVYFSEANWPYGDLPTGPNWATPRSLSKAEMQNRDGYQLEGYIHLIPPDTTPPTISNLKPTGPVGVYEGPASVTISADYSDIGSGIKIDSVSVKLDGNQLQGCNVTGSNVACGPINVNEGDHTISVNVSDNAGNIKPDATSQSFWVVSKNSLQCGDDVSKGDCSKIGTWDPATVTFNLNKDTTCSTNVGWSDRSCIQILGPIVFNGNHHTLQGTYNSNGIGGSVGNTIRNVNIRGFWSGILNWWGQGKSTIINNVLTDNNLGGIELGGFGQNLVRDNVVSNNSWCGICLGTYGGGNTIEKNTVTNNRRGFDANGSGDLVQNNFIGFNSEYGISLGNGASGSQIKENDFVKNAKNAIYSFNDAAGYSNTFDLNYWTDYYRPEQGCSDANNDGFCDSPYIINDIRPSGIDDGKDNHPKIIPNGIGNVDYGPLVPGDILITADPSWVGTLIPGKWKHVGMYIGYGAVVESNAQGVQITSVEKWMYPNMGYVDYLRVNTDQATRDRAVAWATTNNPNGPLGQPYDWNLTQKNENGDSWYCSELVWAAYMHASNDQIDLSNGSQSLAIPPSQLEFNASINNGISVIGGHHEKGWLDTIPIKSVWSSVTFGVFCPLDIEVTDPEGRVINSTTNQIPGALYGEDDLNGDGQLDHWVSVPERDFGNYQIQVIPQSNAQPTDTYSVKAWLDSDGNPPTVLALDVLVSNIPAQPYIFNSLAMQLNLSNSSTYWASYADYLARELSVDLSVQNNGGNDVYGAVITDSANTNGVTLLTAMPASVGDIPASGTGTVTLKYEVPDGVSTFRISLTGSARDVSGTTYLFPQ